MPGMDQINRVAQDVLDWSQRSREWVSDLVQREVKRQLSALGIATREDLDALRKRVRELERGSSGAGSKGTGSRRKSSSKTGAKKSTAKRSRARASSSEPPTASVAESAAATGLGDPGAATT